MALALTLLKYLRRPYRDYRVALLTGTTLSALFHLSRLFEARPLAMSHFPDALQWHLALGLLGTVLLIIVANAYQVFRYASSAPPWEWAMWSIPGVAAVGGFLYLEARWQGMEQALWSSLGQNLGLGALVFIGIAVLFEVFWHLPLWWHLPSEAERPDGERIGS